jgi:hypothetical protein
LTGLVKKIDRQLDPIAFRHPSSDRLGVFVIFCNDDPRLKGQLEELLGREKVKHVVFCTTNAAGPKRYKLAREADLTVVIYDDSQSVRANFALREGELSEDKAREILKAFGQVLSGK